MSDFKANELEAQCEEAMDLVASLEKEVAIIEEFP